ncbi:MAG: MBG domain-containing protein, partial [Pelobacteraceae bacterium]
ISFAAPAVTKTYGAADFGPGAVASSGLPVTYGIDTPAVGTITPAGLVHINGAGPALITASQAGDSNYLPATASQSLVVDRATLMVQANNASRSAGVANPAFTASYSGFVNGETVAVLSGTPAFFTPADLASPAGEYPILPLPGDLASANYIFNFFPGILAVDLQSQTITFNQLPTKTYGDASFTISATSSSANPIVLQSSNPAVATIAGNTVTIAGPGTALITASQLGTPTHALAVAMQLLTVDKATLTVAADNAGKLSGDPNPPLTYTATGFVGADTQLNACSGTPDLTSTATPASPAGSYPIAAAAGTLSCAKYNPVFVNGVLAVGITSQNITFTPLAPATYGDASFDLSATGGASGNAVTFSSSNPAVATVSGTSVTITGAGSTTIIAKQEGSNSFAPATSQQILNVNRKNLTVTADAKNRAYNVANPALTVTYGGFVYSDTQTVLAGAPQLSTTALIASSVGAYPITVAANNLSAANYDFTFGNSTLTVVQATPVITWSNPADITYGTALGAGQLNATFNTAGTAVYTPLSATLLSAGPAQNLTVDFTPTDAVNYTTASKTVAINVNKAAQLITFNPPASTTYGAAPISLSAAGGASGNPVTFAYVSGPGNLVGTTLTVSGAGNIVVSASQPGNANYSDAVTVNKTIYVAKDLAAVTLSNLAATYDGTAKAATATTTPSGKAVIFTYNGSTTVPTAVGSYAVVATINDANYTGSANDTLVIAKATPVITWNTPAAITAGSALSATQLNATANVAGTFVYTPAAGSVPTVGNTTLSVSFTPSDSNYNSVNASVTLTVNAAPVISDTTPPTVDTFSIPASLTGLTCPITGFTASDAIGVTGYLVSENASQPAANAVWSATAPSEYIFASQGTKTLYAFAKDAAGNVSVPLSAGVTITISDTTAPTVDAFTIQASLTSLTCPIATLTATDDNGVTAWLLSETPTATAGDSRWSTTKPADYTFSGQGSKTLYAFAKDAAGNVSAPLSANITITMSDTTPPTVDAFSISTSQTSLTCLIVTLSASDTSGVTGYFISESATPPAAGATGWSLAAPTSYTFASQGAKTLYIFTMDAAGNVSLPVSASVTITLSDTTAPSITNFTIPAASASLTVAVSSFAAIDDTAVTGYLLSETNTATADSGNWTATPTSSYTFVTAGAKTLYAFARDAAGNISIPVTSSVTISLPDVSAPTVSGFSVTGSSASLTVAVTNFTATDDTAVTGYLVSESATAPAAADSGWTSTPPASYTFATGGSKTLYSYVKDAAGNVSAAATTTVTVSSVLRNGNGGSGPDPTIADALKALRASLGLVTLSSDDQTRYDVAPLSSNGVPEGNGIVDFSDAILILRRTIGIGNW